MSWRDRLRPASFRGVVFSVLTVESGYGRRQVTHQAALVDVPFSEDLGRAADQFQLEGYLVGENYDQPRDELIKAMRDTAGPGRFVHPYQGEKSVIASGFRIREDSAEQRMCRFTVTFEEAGELSQPTETVDAPNVLAGRAEAVKEVSTETFAQKFGVDGFPQFVRDNATATLTSLGAYLATPTAFLKSTYNEATGIFSEVNGFVGDTFDFVSENVSDFQSSVGSFLGDVTNLIDFPTDLADRITTLIGGVRNTFGSSSGNILSGLLSLFARSGSSHSSTTTGSSTPTVNPTAGLTPSRAQIIANNAAITDIVRETVATQLAVVAVSQPYDTIDTAVKVRDVVADVIDQEAELTVSDAMYTQLTQTRAEVIKAIPLPDQSAARLVPYVPPATLPALVIAQTLYDDASQADQIVSRNMPRHPGFVTGGQPLQVLSDV